MSDKIEQAREVIASLINEREFLTAKNAPLKDLCQSMCQECINQGVDPSVFYLQWGETEVGKEMLERSAQIVKVKRRIEEMQDELSILEKEIGANFSAVVEPSAASTALD
jgi:hypothetical protein